MLLSSTDYTRLTPRPLTLRIGITPPSVTLTRNGDQICQEGDEDFFLQPSVIGNLPSNLFLCDTLRIVILDKTGKGTPVAGSYCALVSRITWTENYYRAGEAGLSVLGIIQMSATLACDVPLRVYLCKQWS